MTNYVIKFKFTTPIHFGTLEQRTDLYNTDFIMQSDSIFSALCIQANKMYGQDGIDKLVDMCKGNFALSTMMPYDRENYFLPKPFIVYDSNVVERDRDFSKKMKKLNYIPIADFDTFNQSMKGNSTFNIQKVLDKIDNLGYYDTIQKVKVARDEKDNEPYHVGTFNFSQGAGTYMVVTTNTDSEILYIAKLLNGLMYDGIGGRRSSGYGKFTFEIINLNTTTDNELKVLDKMLNRTSERYMTLSLYLPKDNDTTTLNNAFYMVARRSGFVESTNYNSNLVKKRDSYVFCVGSTFTQKGEGQLRDVSQNDGKHKVYKLFKPLFLGVYQ